jgi:serine/threonine protein kinase
MESYALFAVKSIAKSMINSTSKQTSHILNERDILYKLNNSNYCVHISNTFQDEKNLYLLLEYLPGGDLMQMIK